MASGIFSRSSPPTSPQGRSNRGAIGGGSGLRIGSRRGQHRSRIGASTTGAGDGTSAVVPLLFWFLLATASVMVMRAIRLEVGDGTINKLIGDAERFVVEQRLHHSPLSARNDFALRRQRRRKKKRKGSGEDDDDEEGDEEDEEKEDNLLGSQSGDTDDDDGNEDDDDLVGLGRGMDRDADNSEEDDEGDLDKEEMDAEKRAAARAREKAKIRAKVSGDDDRAPVSGSDDEADEDENDDDNDDDVDEDEDEEFEKDIERAKDQLAQQQRQEAENKKPVVDDFEPTYGPEVANLVKKHPRACAGKEPMLQTLHQAKIALDAALCRQLPPWSQVVDLYGDEPVVLGLETCQAYRDAQAGKNKAQRGLPKLSGLWNTGTTALSASFLKNFADYDPRWQIHRATVPWGKHTPLWLKYINRWPTNNQDDPDQVLPIVVVRDPFRWMNTMCKEPYDARWKRGLLNTKGGGRGRCPNFLPTMKEKKDPYYKDVLEFETFDLNATNYQASWQYLTHYKSLADLWSSWNGDYLHASFPRLLIRMEDTVFFPEKVMRIISECSGMPIREPFDYITKKGKDKSDTTLASAMMKYGTDRGRISTNMTHAELEYLREALDPTLMKLMRYRPISEEDLIQAKSVWKSEK